jgi:phage protein D
MAHNYIPTFEVYKGGENITARFQDRATDIKVDLASGNGMDDTLTIMVDDRDWAIARPQVGDFIEVRLGYQDTGVAFMNVFEIDEVTFSFPPRMISIHGKAQGNNSLLKVKFTKEYENKTLKQILEDVAKQAGLSANIAPEFADQKIPFLNGVTSLQSLITKLEQRFGAVAKISNGSGVLSFTKRDAGRTASNSDMPVVVYGPSSFADIQVKHNNRSSYPSTETYYRDKTTNQRKSVQAPSTVQSAPGSSGGPSKPYKFEGREFPSEGEAKAAAQSIQSALDRGTGEASFTLAQGDPWLRDQTRILISGTRDGIDGSYVADIVSHHYNKATGIKTTVKTQPGGLGDDLGQILKKNPEKAITPGPGQTIGDVLKGFLGAIIPQ